MTNSEQFAPTKSRGTPFELFVDPRPTRAISRSLYRQISEAIAARRLVEGDLLPSSRELARQLGVSRHTITTVYDQLVGEGYVTGHAGGGTRVAHHHASRAPRRPPQLGDAPAPADPPQFDLRPGAPDPQLFPAAEWNRCMRAALRRAPMGFGHPAGSSEFRQAIAAWVSRSRGLDADPGRIVVTSGAQHAIDLVMRTELRPGDVLAIEDPGYPPVRLLAAHLGVTICGVPVDAEGIDVGQIPATARLVYVTPAHQNPTGTVMSMRRRLALLDFARRHGATVIEDDYDSEYRHVARPLEPLHRLDPADHVVYVQTFSKVLSPALRVGFAVLPDRLVEPVVGLRHLVDVQPAEPQQSAITAFVAAGHLGRHLRRTRPVYTARHALVSRHLGEGRTAHLRSVWPTCAGLHVAALLDGAVAEARAIERLASSGVAVGPLAPAWHAGGPPGLIIGFGRCPTAQLGTALETLDRVLEATS